MTDSIQLKYIASSVIQDLTIESETIANEDSVREALCSAQVYLSINGNGVGYISKSPSANPFINLVKELIDLARKNPNGVIKGDIKLRNMINGKVLEIKGLYLKVNEEENIKPLKKASGQRMKYHVEDNWLETINDGEAVSFDSQAKYWILCDFEKLLSKKWDHLSPSLLQERVAQNEENMAQNAEKLDIKAQTLTAIEAATAISKILLGEPRSDDERFAAMKCIDLDGTQLKKLSESKNGSACTEFSLLGKHVLDKLGVKAIFVNGTRTFSGDSDREPHSYLVLPDDNIIFDIMQSVVTNSFVIYSHTYPLNFDNLQNKRMDCFRAGYKDDRSRDAQFTSF